MSLHEAARVGDRELVKKLLKKDGRKNCVNVEVDMYGQTALHIVAEEGHADLAAFLIDKYGARVNATDNSGWTALFCACKWGRVRVAEVLLQHGADAALRSHDRSTALHYYVRHDFPAQGATDPAVPALALRVLRALLDNGADLNAQNTNGESPLHVAAYLGFSSSLEALLALGADVNCTDRNGETALHHAARRGNITAIKLLLNFGAERNAKADSGTPKELAESFKQMEAAQVIDTYVAMPPTLAQQAVLNTTRSTSKEESSGSRRGASGASAAGPTKVKVVLLGDPSTSKTQILASYARANTKLRQNAVDIEERGLQLDGEVVIDGRSVTVELIDAPPSEASRASVLPLTTLFLIFFSVIDPESYTNALKKWVSEACYYCPGTSCILVGLNAHLRTDPATLKHLKTKGITPISIPQATELAKRVKAIKYTEYAQHESGAAAFFEDAIRSLVFPSTRLQKEMSKRERMLEKVRTEVALAMSENKSELSFKKRGWDSTYIPKSFGKDMRDIKKLVLSDNKLFFFPLALLELTKLQTLELRNNALTYLPDALPRMSSLKKLDVENNQLSTLPGEMGVMTQLEELKLRGNMLDQFLPPEAQANGIRGILAYLRDLHKGAERCYRMKIMFVGKEAAGKTSLSYYLLNNKKMDRTPLSTDGIDINSWEIPFSEVEPELGEKYMKDNWSNKPISFSVWDFAGQEVYYSTHQFYLSRRSVYLVVFNLTDPDIASGDYHRVSYWLQSVTAKARGAPIVVVGTRQDLCQPNKVTETLTKMQEQFSHFGVKHFLSVSAHTGKGLKELRSALIELALKQRTMGEQIPRSYLELESLVQRKKQELLASKRPPTLPYGEFRMMAITSARIEDDETLLRATEFLHELGSLVYFRKPGLSDIIILDPHWLTQVMATVVSSKTSLDRGILHHKFLTSHIWKGDLYPPHLHDTLLLLLEKFQIMFRMRRKRQVLRATQDTVGPTPNQLSFKEGDKILLLEKAKVGKWWKGLHNGNVGYFQQSHIRETNEPPEFTLEDESLVPCLLPTDPPAGFDKQWQTYESNVQQIGRRWKFDFLPLPFFPQLIVRMLHFMESRVHWRYGIVIERENAYALIQVQHSEGYLSTLVRGDNPAELAELIAVIEEEVDTLREWFGVTFTEAAASCPHCYRERIATPHYFPVDALETASANNIQSVTCPAAGGAGTAVPLTEVAPDIAMTGYAQISYSDLQMSDVLGEGAYADVFKGTLKSETVAVKKLKNTKGFKEFRTEVKFMSGVEHDNIVVLRGVCLNPPCVITEFMELGNLHSFLEDSRNVIDWRQAILLARDIARGMNFLHSMTPPKIHRDLKSPNILLARRNDKLVAKVADFGTSRSLAPTIGGRMVDNPIWLAPEVMRNEEYTEKADVYSFGIILYELFSRQFPFGKKTRFQIELDVVAGLRPELPTDCPPSWAALTKQCWHEDPSVRPSFSEVLDRLGESSGNFLVPVAYRACGDYSHASSLASSPSSDSSTPKIPRGDLVFVVDASPPFTPTSSPISLLYGLNPISLSLDALSTQFELIDYEQYYPGRHLDKATVKNEEQGSKSTFSAGTAASSGPVALSHRSNASRRKDSTESGTSTHTGQASSSSDTKLNVPTVTPAPSSPSDNPDDSKRQRKVKRRSRNASMEAPPPLSIPIPSEFGLARILDGSEAALPAAATKLDNSAEIKDEWEVALQVEALWIDRRAASAICNNNDNEGEATALATAVQKSVAETGKFYHAPSDSSALVLGSVLRMGVSALANGLAKESTRVVACSSARGIPLTIEQCGNAVGEQLLPATGTAIIFPCVSLVTVPSSLPAELALLAVEVSSSLHQVERLIGGGRYEGSVLVVGCGRVGLMTLAFVRRLAPKARILAIDVSAERLNLAQTLAKADSLQQMDAQKWTELVSFSRSHTSGRGADLVLNCTVAPNTEAASILAARRGGTVVLSPRHGVDKERLLGGLANDVDIVVAGGGSGAVPRVIETVFDLLLADRPLHALFTAIARLPPSPSDAEGAARAASG